MGCQISTDLWVPTALGPPSVLIILYNDSENSAKYSTYQKTLSAKNEPNRSGTEVDVGSPPRPAMVSASSPKCGSKQPTTRVSYSASLHEPPAQKTSEVPKFMNVDGFIKDYNPGEAQWER